MAPALHPDRIKEQCCRFLQNDAVAVELCGLQQVWGLLLMSPTGLKMTCTWAAGQEDTGPSGLRVPTAHLSSLWAAFACFICYIEKETPIFTLLGLLDKKLFL